jgi:hypothetical protein
LKVVRRARFCYGRARDARPEVRRASSSALRDYVAQIVRAMTTARAAAAAFAAARSAFASGRPPLAVVVHGASGS